MGTATPVATRRGHREPSGELLTVQRLASQSGLRASVVRYYARIGVLVPASFAANGYRRFQPFDVHRLRFIRAAQRFGFSLTELREILWRSRGAEKTFPFIRNTLRHHLAEHDSDASSMSRQRAMIRSALRRWDGSSGIAPTGTQLCALIEGISRLERQ